MENSMQDTPQQTATPFVTVIVPVYNDAQRIGTCVGALLAQTYPRDCYEVIVVDNGSSDATREVAGRFPITVLVENEIQSSYAARNRGIRHAKGELLAFTDSDCTPAPQWIAEGVRAMREQGADLVGGNVRFVYSPSPTGAEVYDSISNLQMEQSIRERKVAKTANLFVRRSVFDEVGLFQDGLQSGGDIFWTKQATSAGKRLVYAPTAEISHPTRRLRELLRKQYRVGRGHRGVRARERAEAARQGNVRRSKLYRALDTLKRRVHGIVSGFMPLPLSFLRDSIVAHEIRLTPLQLFRVWFAGWLARAATMIGRLSVLRVQ